MTVTHKLEWYHEAGFIARNKEWAERVKRREVIEEKNSKHYTVPEPIPAHLYAHPYTEARQVGRFWLMVYGLQWEEQI